MMNFKHLIRYSKIKCLSYQASKSISTVESGFLKVNGSDLFYERSGNSDKTLLCIPGALGTTRSDFSYQLDHLSKEFTVVSFDPRGYGRSVQAKRTFDSNFFHSDARDAASIMKELGLPKYSVLGWSDGGICGIILTANEQEAVENFILWGSNSFVTKQDIELIEQTRDLSKWSKKMRDPLELTYGKEGLQSLWNNWMDGFFNFNKNPESSICIEELKRIICPTLILHGMKDAMLPEFHADFIHKNVKNSKLIKWPNGKHNLHMRYHEEFNKLVKEFIMK